jgi:hypothetical protein
MMFTRKKDTPPTPEEVAALPRAICWVCGTRVAAGRGTRLPKSFGVTGSRQEFHNLVIAGPESGMATPSNVDGWRRAHDGCKADVMAIVTRVLGARMPSGATPRQVGKALAEVPLALSAARAQRGAQRWPFDWITPEEREALAEAIKRAIRADAPRRCKDGACGACGRSRSIHWRKSPLRWSDGTPAPLCQECRSAADGWSLLPIASVADIRMAAERLHTGIAFANQEPMGMRLYADLADGEHRGHREPWAYSPALAEFRELAWRAHPTLIPDPDIRARYVAERAEAERETRRRIAAELEAATPGGALTW